jgi:hypothetical protein
MRKVLLFLISACFIASCSNPLDKQYNKATMAEDLKAIAEAGRADTSEVFLLAMNVAASELTGEKHEGKTYRQILHDAKARKARVEEEEKKQEELARIAKLEEEKRVAALSEVLRVTVFDKGFVKYNYEDYITYKFAFQNNTNKDVRAFKGTVIFNDLFDTEIKSFSITYDQGVPAGKVKNYEATTDYNQFISSDKLLKNKDLKDMKVVWVPEKIMYTDGSTLE